MAKRKRRSKKGQGISLNVIVIAAIALLVLVVLSVVFLGKLGSFREASGNCESQGGENTQCAVGVCPPGYSTYSTWSCSDTDSGVGQICCLKV